WELIVPDSLEEVIVKVVAGTATFSDGEQQLLPILPNEITVHAVQPFVVLPNEKKTIPINDSLDTSLLQISINAHPLMGVMSSLRTLSDYPYECSEQLTSKWFAYKMLQAIKLKDTTVSNYFLSILNDTTYKTLLAQ